MPKIRSVKKAVPEHESKKGKHSGGFRLFFIIGGICEFFEAKDGFRAMGKLPKYVPGVFAQGNTDYDTLSLFLILLP